MEMHKSLDHEIKIKFKKSPGQGACLKGMSRTIIIQGKKTQLRHKNSQSRSRCMFDGYVKDNYYHARLQPGSYHRSREKDNFDVMLKLGFPK